MTSQPLTFITGATGFVGAAVARVLAEKGHKLRVLSRPNNDRRNLEGLKDIQLVEGDLGKPETYIAALHGCQALFHVAADYRIWVTDAEAMHRINVDGTHALMEAALTAGVQRIVYTSSVATLGNVPGGEADENTSVTIDNMIGIYKCSKFFAEQTVQHLIRQNHLPCVIVNPSTPIGPRDIKPTPTGRIIVEAARGHMPAYVDTGLNIVHVDDVAMGHWLAFEHGAVGERYILGGTNLGLGEILTIIAAVVGRPAPKVKLPRLPLYPLAWGAEVYARMTGREPLLTLDGLRMAKKKMFFSSAKAERLLGYRPRPAQQAIADAIAWFRDHHYC
jgi:dihydroflavonol-4-reductase